VGARFRVSALLGGIGVAAMAGLAALAARVYHAPQGRRDWGLDGLAILGLVVLLISIGFLLFWRHT
jgi:multisubunit Na+/H+ antiporter MnhB subunit